MKSTTADDAAGEHPMMFAVRACDRFLFRPADPTALGLMRISAGLVILYMHIVYSFGLMGYIGPDTWVSNKIVIDFLRKENPFPTPSSNWKDSNWAESDGEILKGQAIWSIFYHVDDPFWLYVIHYGILLIMFLFTIGLWTRITSALTWLGALMYIQRMHGMLFGVDTMVNLVLIYLMIGSFGGEALSVDRWLSLRRERRRLGSAYVPRPPEPSVITNLATRLIQLNFCLIYFASGTSKLLGSSWWNGTAPNRVLLNYSFAPFQVDAYLETLKFLAAHRWMWELVMSGGVLFTLFLEIGFPFLVWNQRMRWFMLCCSILLHTMIGLFMGLVTFSLVMLAMVLAFVPPEAVRQGLRSIGEQIRQLIVPAARQPARNQALAVSK